MSRLEHHNMRLIRALTRTPILTCWRKLRQPKGKTIRTHMDIFRPLTSTKSSMLVSSRKDPRTAQPRPSATGRHWKRLSSHMDLLRPLTSTKSSRLVPSRKDQRTTRPHLPATNRHWTRLSSRLHFVLPVRSQSIYLQMELLIPLCLSQQSVFTLQRKSQSMK